MTEKTGEILVICVNSFEANVICVFSFSTINLTVYI